MNATATLREEKSLSEFKMRKIIFSAVVFILASFSRAFADGWDQARDFAVDQELSDMKIASLILPPGKHEGGTLQPKTGQISGMSPSDSGAAGKGSSAGIGSSGGGLNGGNTTLDTGTGPGDAGNSTGLGPGPGDAEDSVGSVPPDSGGGTDLTEETPTVGGDVSGGGDYLISADASVGDTQVSADLIPSDSFDDTLLGETTDIGAEIDASGDLAGSEADIGIEADVDGSVSGDVITDDPADGLSSAPTL